MESSGSTDLKINKFRYTWTFKNYEYWIPTNGGIIESPQFSTTHDNKELSWKLMLQPDGSLYLKLCSQNVFPTSLHFYMSLLNTNGTELAIKRTTCIRQTGSSSGLPQYIKRDFVLDEKNKLLDGGALTIVCKIILIGEVTHHPGPISQDNLLTLDSQRRLEHLDDYEQLLFSEDLSDFKLVAGGEELPVHRCILALKSRVFAAMFKHDSKDKKDGRVEILDIEPNILREMLRFVYVGKVNNIDKNAPKLLAAADKYELEGLKTLCVDELVDKLNMDNIDEVLTMLDKYNANKLNKAMIKFIAKNAELLNKSEKF